MILLGILSLLSISWVGAKDNTPPPIWAIFLAFFSFAFGIFLIIKIFIDIFELYSFPKDMPETRVNFFYEFNYYVPEAEGIFEQLKICISRGEIKVNTPLFLSHIDEISEDYKILVRSYYTTKTLKLIRTIFKSAILFIIIFSFLFISDYTVEIFLYGKPGFENTIIPQGNLVNSLIDGLYYSVVTFTSLGYGDIYPISSSIIARLISIAEVLIFFFVFILGINFTLSFYNYLNYMVTPENLKKALKEELEKTAEVTQS